VAPVNIPLDIPGEAQSPMYWSKATAFWNMLNMDDTCDTSQFPMGWLKALALENIACMLVTFEVSQFPMGRLKDRAS
jgi:hypothetical protein